MAADSRAVAVSAEAGGTAGEREGVPSRLHLLTFFRFLAALWVLVLHLQGRFALGLHGPWQALAFNGAYAMSFFFVLSGTVLAYGYFDLGGKSGGTARFYLARFARIYPAYAVTHLACLFWLGIPWPAEWQRWVFVNLTSALGIQAWFPHAYVGANTGTWSISCEYFFYALFPALLPLARRLALPGSLGRAVLYVSLLIGFVGLADIVFAGQGTFPLYYISPALRLPEFFLGMLIGAALRQRPALRAIPPWAVVVAAAAVVLVSTNTAFQHGLWTRANIIVVPAIAALILTAGACELGRVHLTQHGLWRGPRYLGEVSYCFFLAQLPLLMWFDAAKATDSGAVKWALATPWAGVGAFFVVVLLTSILLHEAVEKPVRRALLARARVA